MKIKRAKKQKKITRQESVRGLIVTPSYASEDDISSREGSVHSQQDSDRVRLLQIMQYVKLKMTVSET